MPPLTAMILASGMAEQNRLFTLVSIPDFGDTEGADGGPAASLDDTGADDIEAVLPATPELPLKNSSPF